MIELSRHRVLERIHEGVNSDVFLAEEIATGRKCAVKVARTGVHSARKIAMIKHEYALTRALEIPGVVKPLALEVRPGQAALVMEYAGQSLAHVLRGAEPDVARALRIGIQLAETLGAIHAANVIHKDIKPANVVLDLETSRVKITDFSIATVLSGERAGVGDVRSLEGTLRYISPEQTGRMNRSIDHRADRRARTSVGTTRSA